MFRIYSTLSESKEPLPEGRPLKLFVCGPTVYDYPHIGNARTFMSFDIVVRYLRSRNIEVNYLQNITDIDDKIIARAAEEKIGWKDVAWKYEKIYFNDLKNLNIVSVDRFARATEHIPDIVKQVKTLIEKKHVYEISGDGWYFDLKTFPDYGKLAHRTVDQAEDATSRVDESRYKRNKGDFCVWKFSKPGEPSWDTELGAGRPGWHIEDTAITEKYFGQQYDIHGGAVDLKFPHHEAEIAQQESASGKKPFVKIWMHAGFLFVNGEKMSKSKGNFITIEDLLKKYSTRTFRMAVAMHHYRSPLDWTDMVALQAEKNLANLSAAVARILKAKDSAGAENIEVGKYEAEFHAAMEDDLNTPRALAVLFGLIGEANARLAGLSPASAEAVSVFINRALASLGLSLPKGEIPAEIEALVNQREEYRRNKQFVQSDALRAKLEQLGYRSEDTPLGPVVWPKD